MTRFSSAPSFDFTVVGAGLYGSVFARCAAEAGKSVLLVDRRDHIGGNCYSERVDGIDVHRYGPHIFHTNNPWVWEFVNRFAHFNHYRHRGVVRHGDRLFSFPINLATLHQLWGVSTPAEAEAKLAAVREPAGDDNLESWIVSQVGRELYEIFVRGYTAKQWGRDPRELPSSIIKRIPVRLTWNDWYFDDAYQGIPVDGYTRLFENLLDHDKIRVETGVDFFDERQSLATAGGQLVYSGKIDEFFDYRYGELEYRSLRFETVERPGDFQGAAIVNYGDGAVPYTRIVEHKHFALQKCDRTVLTYEYPQAYERGGEAFYPIRDERNAKLYDRYRKLAASTNVLFGGRLGSYQYYDMHQVIAQAMTAAEKALAPSRSQAA
ncbi:MAG: UDP-galactopyranose mutase [Planctomycetaceae bacterium]|nr:UDP-galactopyranose mutase [Planctomycetaceae bacterium]